MCFQIKISTMDCLLSHDKNQYWWRKREINKKWRVSPFRRTKGDQRWQSYHSPLLLKFPWHLTAWRITLNSNISFLFIMSRKLNYVDLEKTLKPWIPQVFCHCKGLLIQAASVDPFFSHNKHQNFACFSYRDVVGGFPSLALCADIHRPVSIILQVVP